MAQFEDREVGFEKKFARDQELEFKIMARRNRLLGEWAAEKLRLAGAEAEAYVRKIIQTHVSQGPAADDAEDPAFAAIRNDFAAAGVDQSEHRIRRTMDEFWQAARSQVHGQG